MAGAARAAQHCLLREGRMPWTAALPRTAELETFPPSTPACAGGGIFLFSVSVQQRTSSWGAWMWSAEIAQLLSHKCPHLPPHCGLSKLSPLLTDSRIHPSCYSLNTSTGDPVFCQHLLWCACQIAIPWETLTAITIHIWLLAQKFRKQFPCLLWLETIKWCPHPKNLKKLGKIINCTAGPRKYCKWLCSKTWGQWKPIFCSTAQT